MTTEPANNGRALRLTAYALELFALAIPFVALSQGGISDGMVGYIIGQAAMIFVVGTVVGGLVLWKRSRRAKAIGSAAVGAVIFGSVVFTTAHQWTDHSNEVAAEKQLAKELLTTQADPTKPAPASTAIAQTVADVAHEPATSPPVAGHETREAKFTQGLVGLFNQLQSRSNALAQQFQSIDLSNALTPAGLTDATAITENRNKLRKYVSLIDERGAVMRQYAQDARAYFKAADIDDARRVVELDSFEKSNAKSQANFAALDTAQRATAKAMAAMLDFAQRQLGKAQVVNGQIQFSTQDAVDEYNTRLTEFQKVAEREDVAVKTWTDQAQASKKQLADIAK